MELFFAILFGIFLFVVTAVVVSVICMASFFLYIRAWVYNPVLTLQAHGGLLIAILMFFILF